jgi:hypothetical protein
MSECPDENEYARELGRRFVETCRLCEEARAQMTPAERDEQIQIFLAEAMGPTGRLRAAFTLSALALALRRQQHAPTVGNAAEQGET